MVLVDRRAEYADSLWRQGDFETHIAYVKKSLRRSRYLRRDTSVVIVFIYSSAEECRQAVQEHNSQIVASLDTERVNTQALSGKRNCNFNY